MANRDQVIADLDAVFQLLVGIIEPLLEDKPFHAVPSPRRIRRATVNPWTLSDEAWGDLCAMVRKSYHDGMTFVEIIKTYHLSNNYVRYIIMGYPYSRSGEKARQNKDQPVIYRQPVEGR